MDQSDTDQLNTLTPPVTEDNSPENRPVILPAYVTSGLASVISVFCIGLVSGAAGGLLLGATAVVVLQSLELLADNRLLMDQLEKHIMGNGSNETNHHLHDIHISITAVIFGLFSSMLSLIVGLYIGFSAYSLEIKIKGEAAMGKALALAGPVCLMGVTAMGCLLGLALEIFLTMTLTAVSVFLFMLLAVGGFIFSITSVFDPLLFAFLIVALIAAAAFTIHILNFFLKIGLILAVILTPTILAVKEHLLKFTFVPVLLMLIISDIFKIAGQKIIAIPSSDSINTSSVLEAIFVGVFASQLWTVAIGMSLFVSLQTGGAGKICAAAAGSGGAVLAAIKSALPVLGPGPTIGALMGVTGAAGVSLAAAMAKTDQYRQVVGRYGFVGSLGVTVGAAVGAFLSSCAHSGLSRLFMGMCAATIPPVAFLVMFFKS